MIEIKNKKYNRKDENEINEEGYQFTKLIISPNNYYNMIKNDIALLLFVIYSMEMPYTCSIGPKLSQSSVNFYAYFDWFFVFDRTMDLFVGFYKYEGSIETSVFKVI